MKPLLNILRKEIKELLTPATFIPVVVIAILFASLGGFMSGITDDLTETPAVGIVDEDNGNLSTIVLDSITSNSKPISLDDNMDINQMLEKVKSSDGTALIIIPEGFSETIASGKQASLDVYYIMNSTGMLESFPSSMVMAIISQASNDLSAHMIEKSGISSDIPTAVLQNPISQGTNVNTYFNGNVMEDITPDLVSASLSSNSFIVPIIVMMIVIMAGGIVISSMGMEKENKTLETLLTMPVKRSQIVVGKLAAAAIVGLVMALIYMVGMIIYMDSLMSGAQVDLVQYGMSLGIVDYLLLGISLFLAILSALALCMILGIFAKDYKTAQGLIMPVTFLAMVPFFVIMLFDFNALPTAIQGLLFAIPFSHPMMAINNLMLDNYSIVLAGIGYELLFAAVMIVIAVILFKKDILITGRSKKKPKNQIVNEEGQ
ncbi:ABC transporter permease [Candidatus Methanomassiliicoccus intestinalis]|uniref:ABC transporter permease n=1 Tax=Candidatus Methanomassiliicoccus intestinalis TaxID=1406512 RepID=UPI0037DC3B9D